jgi:hypothetical protein
MSKEGKIALGGLAAIFVWTFAVLPLYYGPRDYATTRQCSAKEIENYSFWEKARCDPVAYFTGWLVGFTGVLAISTIGLWIVTWRSGVRQSRDMEAAVIETRRIGEAQVRAYVSIKSAFIGFETEFEHPRIRFVATNTGQSPAKNFVWNVAVQYASMGATQTHEFGKNWDKETGFDIPATSDSTPQGAMIPNMSLKIFREKPKPGALVPSVIIARVKLEFRYTDIFDRSWLGEAYFCSIDPGPGVPAEKLEALTPIPKPTSWD